MLRITPYLQRVTRRLFSTSARDRWNTFVNNSDEVHGMMIASGVVLGAVYGAFTAEPGSEYLQTTKWSLIGFVGTACFPGSIIMGIPIVVLCEGVKWRNARIKQEEQDRIAKNNRSPVPYTVHAKYYPRGTSYEEIVKACTLVDNEKIAEELKKAEEELQKLTDRSKSLGNDIYGEDDIYGKEDDEMFGRRE